MTSVNGSGPAAAPARPRLLWALTGVFVLFSLTLLPVPFTRDQGIYGYVGWRWLAGGVPYRDAFEGKGPVLFAVYAVGLLLSGGAAWGVNLLDLLARAAAMLLAGRAATRAAGERAGLFAAVLAGLPLLGVFNFMWWNGQSETFMLPLLAGSTLLVLRGGRRDLVAAGMLSALALLTKLTAILHLWLLIWVVAAGGPGPQRLVRAGLFVLGLALGSLPLLAYFAAAGALGDFWEANFLYSLFYSGVFFGGGDPPIPGFWLVFFLLPILVPFAVVRSRPGESRRGAWFLGLWLIESLAQVVGQGKYFLYHWAVVVPAIGAVAGVGLAGLERLVSRRAGPEWARTLVYAVLIFFTIGYGRRYWQLEETMGVRAYLAGSLPTTEYYANFSTEDFRLVYNMAAADFARAGTEPADTVLVFGYDPLVNLLAERASPTRFILRHPLTFEPRSEAAARLRERWRREFMDRLRARPPALVAIADQDQNPVSSETSLAAAKKFTAFWQWLGENYQPVTDVGNFHFFARK
jgi:hypothetical protein